MNLFRKKDIAHLAQDAEKSGFVRNLTAFDLVFLGIGSVIGTGIFVLTGVGAALYAGPGIAISFILASVACAFAGLAYAEYSSMVPVSGSAYAYTYASLGEFMAFLVGWNLILEYTVTCSTVAAGWSGYVVGLLTSGGLNLSIDFLKVPAEGGIINLPAVFITMFLCILLVRGTKESIFINRILVFVKIAVIFIFLCLAIPNIDVRNWDPFLPFGYQGIASGAAIVFFAYIGFDGGKWFSIECCNDNETSSYPIKSKKGDIAGVSDELYSPTGYFTKKLVSYQNVNTSATNINYVYSFPIIRLSDLYLLYAEALNELNETPTTDVYYYVQQVRNKAGLDEGGSLVNTWRNHSNRPDKPTTQRGMREIIQKERMIELAFEGHRYHDVRRWKLGSTYLNTQIKGWSVLEQDPEYFYNARVLFTRKFMPRDYLWPIKTNSINRNPKLVQNPQW